MHGPTHFITKVRFFLRLQRATITDLAYALQISRQAIYWKINNHSWSLQDVYDIARILKVDPKDLV